MYMEEDTRLLFLLFLPYIPTSTFTFLVVHVYTCSHVYIIYTCIYTLRVVGGGGGGIKVCRKKYNF